MTLLQCSTSKSSQISSIIGTIYTSQHGSMQIVCLVQSSSHAIKNRLGTLQFIVSDRIFNVRRRFGKMRIFLELCHEVVRENMVVLANRELIKCFV